MSTPDATSRESTSMRTDPLRVAFVVTSLPVGGAEVLLLNLVRGMDRQRFAPQVMCTKEGGALHAPMAAAVPVHTRFLQSKYDLRVIPRMTRFFRRHRIDAVVTVGAGDKMFWGRLCARLAGVPVVCSALHSTGWPDSVGRLNRLLTPCTDGFIACAQRHAAHLVHREGFPADRVYVVPNGVDTDRFKPDGARRAALRAELGLPPHVPLVGVVAALRPEKNLIQFVEAAARTLRVVPDAHFVVVGDGPQRSVIEQRISELGLVRRIHLLGRRADTEAILAGLDVFCLTSRNEANPVSILEALACGVPAVSPEVGSVPESVLPEQTGLLTQPLSVESTTQALVRLLDAPQWARRLGEQGRQHVVENFSLSVMVDGYESLLTLLYNRAAERRRWPLLSKGDRRDVLYQPARGAEIDCACVHNVVHMTGAEFGTTRG
ncbi:MAG: glycosyltransferase [Planctomycetota bacterium]|nr:MAG: glycosyltransferase [Planctomycetota bacterium]